MADHLLVLNWNRQAPLLLRQLATNGHGDSRSLGRWETDWRAATVAMHRRLAGHCPGEADRQRPMGNVPVALQAAALPALAQPPAITLLPPLLCLTVLLQGCGGAC